MAPPVRAGAFHTCGMFGVGKLGGQVAGLKPATHIHSLSDLDVGSLYLTLKFTTQNIHPMQNV
jgi:hypothetical protein